MTNKFSIIELVVGVIFITLTSCAERVPALQFIVYEDASTVDTTWYGNKCHISTELNVIVSGFRRDDITERAIDSFYCARATEWANESLNSATIAFFRESDKTNLKYLADWPKSFWRHSIGKDLEYSYRWYPERFGYKNVHRGKQYTQDKSEEDPCQ